MVTGLKERLIQTFENQPKSDPRSVVCRCGYIYKPTPLLSPQNGQVSIFRPINHSSQDCMVVTSPPNLFLLFLHLLGWNKLHLDHFFLLLLYRFGATSVVSKFPTLLAHTLFHNRHSIVYTVAEDFTLTRGERKDVIHIYLDSAWITTWLYHYLQCTSWIKIREIIERTSEIDGESYLFKKKVFCSIKVTEWWLPVYSWLHANTN